MPIKFVNFFAYLLKENWSVVLGRRTAACVMPDSGGHFLIPPSECYLNAGMHRCSGLFGVHLGILSSALANDALRMYVSLTPEHQGYWYQEFAWDGEIGRLLLSGSLRFHDLWTAAANVVRENKGEIQGQVRRTEPSARKGLEVLFLQRHLMLLSSIKAEVASDLKGYAPDGTNCSLLVVVGGCL